MFDFTEKEWRVRAAFQKFYDEVLSEVPEDEWPALAALLAARVKASRIPEDEVRESTRRKILEQFPTADPAELA